MEQLRLLPEPEPPPGKPPDPFPEFGTWLRQQWGSQASRLSSQRRSNEYKRYERILYDRVARGLPVKDLALTNLAVWHWYPMPAIVREAMIDAVARQAEN